MTFDPMEFTADDFILVSPGTGSPEITVLMPIFNQKDFVVEAVESVLAQRGVVAEIIVSDDASEDGTFEAALACVTRWLEQHGPRHRIVLRRGTTRLRRDHLALLVDEAGCDLVFQAHGDDVSHPDRARILLQVFQENPHAAMTTTTAHEMDAAGRMQAEPAPMPSSLQISRYPMGALLDGDPLLIGFALAWRRSSLARFARLDSNLAAVSHDRIMAFRAGLAGQVLLIHVPLVIRRNHEGNWYKILFDRRDQVAKDFGSIFFGLSRLRTMLSDVAKAQQIGMMDPAPCEEISGRIRWLLEEHQEALFKVFRELTRSGRHLAWLDEKSMLELELEREGRR